MYTVPQGLALLGVTPLCAVYALLFVLALYPLGQLSADALFTIVAIVWYLA